ncbi:MAG: Glu/Leu/Phe/Val dehydrogenase [Saprospiraceae bacterium]|nr:Glu/Leu/Phe/Val dehydrogenase [Saprospiraceae bacterium]
MQHFAALTPADFFHQNAKTRPEGFLCGNTVSISNPAQGALAGMEQMPDYDQHEGVFYRADEASGCLFFAFIHNTNRGQAQGGTRFFSYDTMLDLLSDGLRLSKAMSEKCAVAGLWWGGGKSIICPVNFAIKDATPEKRKVIFANFGKFIASLHGSYVAAEDMNTTPEDMQTILSQNRFVTCIPKHAGGSGNPSPFTAEGVFKSMLATAAVYEGQSDLSGMSVSIQGLGNVGSALARFVLNSGVSKLYVTDLMLERMEMVKSWAPEVVEIRSSKEELLRQSCDIFAPCAGGKVIDDESIAWLNCRYVIGAANNQLERPEKHAAQLHEKGILYLPDFFINRMGIINCANEQYGWLESTLQEEVVKIYEDTVNLLTESRSRGLSPQEMAMIQAGEAMKKAHPIWPNRGKQLIQKAASERS